MLTQRVLFLLLAVSGHVILIRCPGVITTNQRRRQLSCQRGRLVRVMQELVEVYGKPEAIRLDNGPEMTSHTFVDWARDQGIRLMFIQPGKPNQNAFIERFNRSFRTEVLDACLFDSVDQVQAQADAWLTDYNEQRPYESLGNVPPAVYMPRTFPTGVSTFGLSS